MERIMKHITFSMNHSHHFHNPWWKWAFALFLPVLLSLAAAHILVFFFRTKSKAPHLPPGPSYIPIFSAVHWLRKNLFHIEPIIRDLRDKYGPILTLRITSRPTIFISDHTLAHDALVHHGAALADRMPPTELAISLLPYGPLWRSLRRNITSEILHPSRIRQFADGRTWVLEVLLGELNRHAAESADGVVSVMESFQFAMFCSIILVCFGQKLELDKIREIEDVQKLLHTPFAVKMNVLTEFQNITKIVFRKKWKMLLDTLRKQHEIFIPLIRARASATAERGAGGGVRSYVDSLLELSIPEVRGERKLTEAEVSSLCGELLSAGTETVATTLEWIMAELVIHQKIQDRVWEEIQAVLAGMENKDEMIKEEDLPKMPYLKAVIMEGLRRHPPVHFVLPHVASEDVEVGGYVIPKGAMVNFMVAEMGWDEKVWDEPMEFKPERFLVGGDGEEVDITGSREIKMMPFGVGRRICPGHGLAMLQLEHLVANLVREFMWRPVEGEVVDLTEMVEVTVLMKNPLRAKIVPRRTR